MSRLYKRYFNVIAEGASGSINFSELRCRFEIHPLPLMAPATMILRVTNMRPDHALQFVRMEYKRITLEAGYESNYGVIFQGNIIQGIKGRETPTDTMCTIVAADGDHGHNYGVVHTTLPPGSTPNDHVNAAIQAMSPFGISRGFFAVDLSKPSYPRAVTLFGMARDVLNRVAKGKNCAIFYDREEVTMIQKGQNRPGVVKLNSLSGLIGMPTQDTAGIWARCLINPAIRRGGLVYIDQKDVQGAIAPISNVGTNDLGLSQLAPIAADGLYEVKKIDIFGDTRGQPWYMDLGMLAKNAPPPPNTTLIQYDSPPYLGPN